MLKLSEDGQIVLRMELEADCIPIQDTLLASVGARDLDMEETIHCIRVGGWRDPRSVFGVSITDCKTLHQLYVELREEAGIVRAKYKERQVKLAAEREEAEAKLEELEA